jgi:hypothetical protein
MNATRCLGALSLVAVLAWPAAGQERPKSVLLTGVVREAGTGRPLPARIYVQGPDGAWHFAAVDDPAGSAVEYRAGSGRMPRSVELHTTLSAHRFRLSLPPGNYAITVERGKEYFPLVRQVALEQAPVHVELELARWIDTARRRWYSGDTHVHRSVEELRNVMLAEDLNVAFPLVHWVRDAYAAPQTAPGSAAAGSAELIRLDDTHVIYPRNTEYEIFTVDGKPHTLGAFFVLNHRSVFDRGVPPVGPIAAQARREGALIEFDKHNWPWSAAIVPIMQVDLYELANNHVWRTEFGFKDWPELPPDYMHVEGDRRSYTEAGWIDFTFQNYYALLNSGFRLRPTGGTASGVHPVPLGFSRVYVECPEGFSYERWLEGLNRGRSFVTTGPMLFVEVDGQPPGHVFQQTDAGERPYRVRGSVASAGPLEKIEIVVNGQVVRTVAPKAAGETPAAGLEQPFDESIPIRGSSWIAVRSFESSSPGRFRYAHTSPVHIDGPGKPLRPRPEEIGYLIRRVAEQIERSRGVLPPEALAEYERALAVYRQIAGR